MADLTVSAIIDTFMGSADIAAMRTNIGLAAIGNAESLGWTDALLSRLAANSVGLGARLSITAPANASALSSTGYSLTGSNASSMIDLAGTWNTSGNPVAMKIAISNTASGSTAKFLSMLAGASGTTEVFSVSKGGQISANIDDVPGVRVGANSGILHGVGSRFGSVMGLWAVGVAHTVLDNTGIYTRSDRAIGWAANTDPFNNMDVLLNRDAANTLALRNGANAQAFNVYNTYTSGSVYERGFMRWVSNVLEIGTEHAGASARGLDIRAATGSVKIFTSTYNVNTFTTVGLGSTGGFAYQSNALGQHFVLIGDNNGSGGPAEFRGGSGFTLNWRSTTRSDTGANDAGLKRTIAGVVGITDGSTGGGAIGMQEQTAPAAPSANGVYIFAEDNGSGKTRLMARFATGATQQLAIEP